MPRREWDADLVEPTKEYATTAREAGLEIGIRKPDRVRAWLRDDPDRLMDGKRIKLAALYEYALEKKAKLDGPNGGRDADADALASDWRAKRLEFQAKREEIELERMKGNLVEVKRAVRAFEVLLRPFAAGVQDLPRRIALELENRPAREIEEVLRKRIDDVVVEFEGRLAEAPETLAALALEAPSDREKDGRKRRGRPRSTD